MDQFVKDADGGITLQFQNESPGADNEASWLPAPEGPLLGHHAALLAEGSGTKRRPEGPAVERVTN